MESQQVRKCSLMQFCFQSCQLLQTFSFRSKSYSRFGILCILRSMNCSLDHHLPSRSTLTPFHQLSSSWRTAASCNLIGSTGGKWAWLSATHGSGFNTSSTHSRLPPPALVFLSETQKIRFLPPGYHHNSRLIWGMRRKRVIHLQVCYYRRIRSPSHS